MNKPFKQIAARFPVEETKQIEKIAEAMDRTVAQAVRQALRDWVQRHQQGIRL